MFACETVEADVMTVAREMKSVSHYLDICHLI